MIVRELALRGVLALLAVYHVGIGLLSVSSLEATTRVTRAAYGIELGESPQLAHAVRMLGLYALAVGTLLALAARDPRSHREVIIVVAALQLCRAAFRVGYRRVLSVEFRLSRARNAFNTALLVLESAVLLVGVFGTM